MGKSPELQDHSHSMGMTEKNWIIFFRAWTCLQLAISLLIVVFYLNVFDLQSLCSQISTQLHDFIFRFLIVLAFVCPLLAFYSLFQTPFGKMHKCIWFTVILALFVFDLLFFSGYLAIL